MKQSRHSAGFVMADAIIALMLVSSLMAGVLAVNSKTLGRLDQAEKRLTATLVAQSIMERSPERDERGQVVIDDVTYFWQCNSTRAPTTYQHKAALQQLEVTVTWKRQTSSSSLTLASARLRSIDEQ